MIHNTNAAYIPSDKPRPIAGFPSVSAGARAHRMFRQHFKWKAEADAQKEALRKKYGIDRETARQIDKWEAGQ